MSVLRPLAARAFVTVADPPEASASLTTRSADFPMWGNAAMSAADMSGSGDGIKAALRAERSYARLAYTDDWIAAMSSSRPPTSMLKSVTTFRWHQAQPNTAPGLQAAWPRAEMIDVRFPRSGAVALTLAALGLYFLRVDDIAGLIGDDAWYMVLAKAISEGSGPRLISSAGTEFLSNVYPPGFPAILSLVFLISPQFPENVVLLKGISIAAMIGAGALTYRYVVQHRSLPPSLAMAITVATVATPALVFLATSTMMSEAVFLFIQLLAVLLIERTARLAEARSSRGMAVLAGVLAAAAFLTRTAGVTVAAAGVLYLARERRWRSVAIFGATAAICVMPWLLYARAHAPTRAELVDHGGLMAVAYADQFWTTEAGTVTARPAGVEMLPGRVIGNVTNIAIRDVGGIFVPLLFRTSGESGLEVIGLGPPQEVGAPSMGSALGTKVVSFVLSLLVVLGFVAACRRRVTVAEPLVVLALGMIVLWPFWTFRFVLPLVPFLFVYLVLGAEAVAGWFGRLRQGGVAPYSVARILLMVIIGLHALDHAQYIAQAYGNPRGGSWKSQADDINQVLDWVRQHPEPAGAVAADNPALVYLHTGRRTVAINSFDDKWSRWRRMGVRYVVSLVDGEPLLDARAELRFKLQDKNVWVYEILPEPPPLNQ